MMCLKIVALICIQFGFGWTLVNKHNPMWPQVSYPHGGPDVDQASIFQRGLCDGSLKCMVRPFAVLSHYMCFMVLSGARPHH